jgi:hypothetical protein
MRITLLSVLKSLCLSPVKPNLNCELSFRNFVAGNYTSLCSNVRACQGAQGVDETSLDVAASSINADVRDVMEQSVPRGYNIKSKSPPWFSNNLTHYIVKKNYFHYRFKQKRSYYFNDTFVCTESVLIHHKI